MSFFLSGFKEMWMNFYNKVIRDASSTVKGCVIGVLFVLSMILLAIAMKSQGKGNGDFIHNWTAFWFGMVTLGLLILYCFLI